MGTTELQIMKANALGYRGQDKLYPESQEFIADHRECDDHGTQHTPLLSTLHSHAYIRTRKLIDRGASNVYYFYFLP